MAQDLQALLAAALRITGEACSIPVEGFNQPLDVDFKADESPVTQIDRATETLIRERLKEQFPEAGIFGEEFGTAHLEKSDVWVIDPIDGTQSFIAGVPLFGMLLALVRDGRSRIGVVRFPALGQVYVGAQGLGATKDRKAIHVSACKRLADAIVFINEGEKLHHLQPDLFSRLTTIGRLRRMAYDCHPHALLAEGRVDAVVDFDLKPYDYLPLVGLIEAAGGVITDWSGAALGFASDGRVVSAATPELHAQLIEMLNIPLPA